MLINRMLWQTFIASLNCFLFMSVYSVAGNHDILFMCPTETAYAACLLAMFWNFQYTNMLRKWLRLCFVRLSGWDPQRRSHLTCNTSIYMRLLFASKNTLIRCLVQKQAMLDGCIVFRQDTNPAAAEDFIGSIQLQEKAKLLFMNYSFW